jgi:hypothetical protein
MTRLRSAMTWTTASNVPWLFTLSTLITVASSEASLSITTLGGFIPRTSLAYSSWSSILAAAAAMRAMEMTPSLASTASDTPAGGHGAGKS